MKSISKLKDEARKHEQREEWEKAIQAYLQVLKVADEEEAEVELPLYNRLGDLCVRLGRPEEAVRHYEQAADRYAEAGLYNNAIALCNKALRYDRDRLELIRKLGQFSAMQGFITDARRYFLDYAERQFNVGRIDDALGALEDFANVSEDADVREMLGRRMAAHGRIGDALNELQRAYTMRVEAGETEKAEALRAEIQAMDPMASAAPRAAQEPPRPAAPVVEELPGLAEPEPDADDLEVATFDDPGTPALEGLQPADDLTSIDAEAFEITGFDTPATPSAHDITTAPVEGLETGAVDFEIVTPGGVEDIGLIREETSFGEMFPEQRDSFDLPLLDDDPVAESTPPQPAAIENTHTPIDLGSDFSFDLSSFGAPAETPVEETPAELPTLGGADDDGIDLPATESDSFDLPDSTDPEPLPMLETGEDFDLPMLGGADDDGIDLPLLGDDDGVDLPTFDDGATEEDTPAPWQLDTPAFEAPVFEAEPEAPFAPEPVIEERAIEEPEADTAFDLPMLEPPAWETPAADVGDAGFSIETPVAEPAPEADAEPEPVPAIELPTWDTEPVIDDLPEPVTFEGIEEGVTAEAAGPPDALDPAMFEAGVPGTDFEERESADDWLDELTAETAAETGALPEPEPPAPEPFPEPEPAAPAIEDVPARAAAADQAARELAANASTPAPGEYIDLGAFITEDDEDEGTRFRIQETAPTGDEDRDFAELLSQFKSKVHEHLPAEDASAHYDLGLAFKEMGLIDEAIGEFQIALRAGEMRLRVYEELGQCFLMKEQYNIAEKVLTRALEMKYDDELELLGVYYHLGRAYEALGRRDQARDAYERVLGMDINFEDVTARLARL